MGARPPRLFVDLPPASGPHWPPRSLCVRQLRLRQRRGAQEPVWHDQHDSAGACSDEDFTTVTQLGWSSSAPKRIVRSTFSAEGHAVCEAFEHSKCAREPTLGILGRSRDHEPLPITIFTDRNPVSATVGRGAIVAAALWQTFHGDPTCPAKLRWISTGKMVADALSKMMSATSLAAICSAKARLLGLRERPPLPQPPALFASRAVARCAPPSRRYPTSSAVPSSRRRAPSWGI